MVPVHGQRAHTHTDWCNGNINAAPPVNIAVAGSSNRRRRRRNWGRKSAAYKAITRSLCAVANRYAHANAALCMWENVTDLFQSYYAAAAVPCGPPLLMRLNTLLVLQECSFNISIYIMLWMHYAQCAFVCIDGPQWWLVTDRHGVGVDNAAA